MKIYKNSVFSYLKTKSAFCERKKAANSIFTSKLLELRLLYFRLPNVKMAIRQLRTGNRDYHWLFPL